MNDRNQEMEQRRREAAEPFWAKIMWLEDASKLAYSLRQSQTCEPPEWTKTRLPNGEKAKE